jgi:protein gp37
VTWNPTVGCTRASAGCDNCYAVRHTQRLAGRLEDYQGLVNPGKQHFNGTVRCLPARLHTPLHWRKPRRVFVDSLSDLFHPAVPLDFIADVFNVMADARAERHTFQVLTKRPDRMARVVGRELAEHTSEYWPGDTPLTVAMEVGAWPLPNVWLGTSVEDQAAAEARIAHLLHTPAAIRFLSCEPLLGPVNLRPYLSRLDWVIVGGESGPRARRCEVGWVRSIVQQCQRAGVPVFVKQLGGQVRDAEATVAYTCPAERCWPSGTKSNGWDIHLQDRKGGDLSEWPEDLRVREWPA